MTAVRAQDPAMGATEPSPDAVTQAGERRSVRIESLRALSALAVIAGHTYAFTEGADFSSYHSRLILGSASLGVDVFFALTGYLIFLPFARRDFGAGTRVQLSGYALNRALRILPLYYVVLIVVGAVDGAGLAELGRFAWFGENFRQILVAKALDGPMWSLVVELHFYLLLPVLAWGLAKLARGRLAVAAGLLLGLAGLSAGVYEVSLQPHQAWVYSLPANFLFFVPGMLLALTRARLGDRRNRPSAHRLARSDLWLCLALAVWLPLFIEPKLEFRLLPVAALGALLVVGSCTLPLRRGRFDGLLDLRLLALVGLASYSLYLWHWPILDWLPHQRPGIAGWVAFLAYGLPICLVAAFLSYRMVEYPPLRLRRRWFSGSSAPRR